MGCEGERGVSQWAVAAQAREITEGFLDEVLAEILKAEEKSMSHRKASGLRKWGQA